MNQRHSKRRKWLEIILIAAFVVAMLMGVGPGVLVQRFFIASLVR